jgi:hypothetical protein
MNHALGKGSYRKMFDRFLRDILAAQYKLKRAGSAELHA